MGHFLIKSSNRVFTVDLPNHGRSYWTDSINYEILRDSLIRFLNLHDLHGVSILGHSLGGKVAMMLALNKPDLVHRLIIVDIAPVNYNHNNLEVLSALESVDLSKVHKRDDAYSQLIKRIPDKLMCNFLLQNLIKKEKYFEWRINLNTLKHGMTVLQSFPIFPKGACYIGPTLFLAGEKSNYIMPDYHAKIDKLFPNFSLVTIHGAGHWVHSEKHDEFVTAVNRFINQSC